MTAPPLPRDKFPATDRWVYLNHAGMGPIPSPAVEAMSQRAMEIARSGELAWPDHKAHVEEVRDRGARLMGAPSEDVAFIRNTTAGLGLVASGLDLGPGDRVVVCDLDFPSSLYPWLALRERGVRVDLVGPVGTAETLPTQVFADAIAAGPPPAVVSTSWVQFRRGWRVDVPALARVAHDAGALLCADVIQGLGVIPAHLDAWGVDFAMADGHKWLLGPPGTGLLYVRGKHRDRLRPLEPGWNSMTHREQWDELAFAYDRSARRYEGGMPNISGVAALGASLELLLDADVTTIWAHVDALCEHLCDGLARLGATVITQRSPGHGSGIVSVTFPGHDAVTLGDRLRARGFVVGARSGALRFSPHGYNTVEELDRLLDALEPLLPAAAEVSR
ncbi:aminotransferase class V-fold PLP-dependent enzyme [Microbispora corallina]|uniref:Cysteine desulfurase n=1 Tax=Microbispora corallina TaxID=83302 RepID=A0ABQ4GBF1_9ACTN|nr:aminotransferase class V-fold PLP-dependent enzyme [Microbispora corallina]GIH44370.1 cysteine desulfurase [Microbispora corallina]